MSSQKSQENKNPKAGAHQPRPGSSYRYPGTDIVQTSHHSNQDAPGAKEPKAADQYRKMAGPYPSPEGKRIAGTNIVQTNFPQFNKQQQKKEGGK